MKREREDRRPGANLGQGGFGVVRGCGREEGKGRIRRATERGEGRVTQAGPSRKRALGRERLEPPRKRLLFVLPVLLRPS